jgi:hypothetical protein
LEACKQMRRVLHAEAGNRPRRTNGAGEEISHLPSGKLT